jgi:hypothetical protein
MVGSGSGSGEWKITQSRKRLPPTVHYPLSTTHCPLPTTHYPLPTTHYPLPTTHYPLLLPLLLVRIVEVEQCLTQIAMMASETVGEFCAADGRQPTIQKNGNDRGGQFRRDGGVKHLGEPDRNMRCHEKAQAMAATMSL